MFVLAHHHHTVDKACTLTTLCGLSENNDVPPLSSQPAPRTGDTLGFLCVLLRKEVIQPHLPVRLPCYDLVPITSPTLDGPLHKGWATGFGCYRLS